MQSLTEAFLEWRDAAAYQREVQTKLSACLQHWRLSLLAAAFDAFSANVIKQRKAKLVGVPAHCTALHTRTLMLLVNSTDQNIQTHIAVKSGLIANCQRSGNLGLHR